MKQVIFILGIIGIFALTACAKPTFKEEFESDKPWIEQLTQVPAYPDSKDLISFHINNTSNQHFVDATSIRVGQDGVIRFSLVVKSSAGAANVSYEGIRCATSERKLYAIGRDDRTWTQPRVAEWQKLDFVRQFYAQRELAKNIFCPQQQIVSNPEEAIQALKAGVNPRVLR